jgi:hypothetical protein
VHDESAIREKENEVRALEIEARNLEKERAGFVRVQKEHGKALEKHRDNDLYLEKVDKTRSQLAKIKDECKNLTVKIAENEKLLLKTHERAVGKAKKLKDIEEKLRENREKMKKGQASNVVTVEMISELEEEIMKLEAEHKDAEKVWGEKLSNLEVEFSNRRVEEEKKLLILKEKEKEVKLNEIRMKEYKKLIVQARHEKKAEQEGANMKEFRSKRNIKHLDKEV